MTVRWRIDIWQQLAGHQLAVPNLVIAELAAISRGKGRPATAARIALRLVREKNLKILRVKEKAADAALLSLAKKGWVIATQDAVMRDKIRKSKGKVIFIRQRKYVRV